MTRVSWEPLLDRWLRSFRPKKIVKIGDNYYRMRRGRPVKVPLKWVGHTTHEQTIRKRKQRAKNKKYDTYRRRGRPATPPSKEEWGY